MRKVLYITKDVYTYKQGNYYAGWLEVFQNNNEVTITEDINAEIDLTQFQLVVFGHSFIDLIISKMKIFNKRYFNQIEFLRLLELKYILENSSLLNNIKNSDIKKIFFSKNDYKLFKEKVLLGNFLNIDLFISHTKSSLDIFLENSINSKIKWLPFSISKDKYYQSKEKKIDIGMRANSNSAYNNGERELFYNKVKNISKDKYSTDLHLSKNGECFLHGQEYIDWLSECHLLVNSVSAYGTVGPKFLEAIACGTVSIALENEYEGLLVADQHYLSIKKDFSNLNSQIDKFFNNIEFKNELLKKSKELLDQQCIENQYENLIKGI